MKKRIYFEMPESDTPLPAVIVEFYCPVCGHVEEVNAIHVPSTHVRVTATDKVLRPSCLSVIDVPKCEYHACYMEPKRVVAFVMRVTEKGSEDGVCEVELRLERYGGHFDSSLVVGHKVNRAGGDMLSWGSEQYTDRDGEGGPRIQGACPHCFTRDAVFFDGTGHTKCRSCGKDMECGAFIYLNPRYVHDYVSLGALGKMLRGHFVSKGFHHGVFEPEARRESDDRDVTLGMISDAQQALGLAFDAEFGYHPPKTKEESQLLVHEVATYLGLDEKDLAQVSRATIVARLVESIWAGNPEGVKADSDPAWVYLNAKTVYHDEPQVNDIHQAELAQEVSPDGVVESFR